MYTGHYWPLRRAYATAEAGVHFMNGTAHCMNIFTQSEGTFPSHSVTISQYQTKDNVKPQSSGPGSNYRSLIV